MSSRRLGFKPVAPAVGVAEAAVLCHAGGHYTRTAGGMEPTEPEEPKNGGHRTGASLSPRGEPAPDRFRAGQMVQQPLRS